MLFQTTKYLASAFCCIAYLQRNIHNLTTNRFIGGLQDPHSQGATTSIGQDGFHRMDQFGIKNNQTAIGGNDIGVLGRVRRYRLARHGKVLGIMVDAQCPAIGFVPIVIAIENYRVTAIVAPRLEMLASSP